MASSVQHHLPRFILQRFATGKRKNPQIYAFDKHANSSLRASVRRVAAERGYYELTLDKRHGIRATLEPSLSRVEAVAATLLERIVKSESLSVISRGDRTQLALFFAIQFVRGPATRVFMRYMSEELGRVQLRLGGRAERHSDEDLKRAALNQVVGAKDYLPYFENKTWLLQRADSTQEFYISDCPLTLYNEEDPSVIG